MNTIETYAEISRDIRIFIEGNPHAAAPMSTDDPNADCIERVIEAVRELEKTSSDRLNLAIGAIKHLIDRLNYADRYYTSMDANAAAVRDEARKIRDSVCAERESAKDSLAKIRKLAELSMGDLVAYYRGAKPPLSLVTHCLADAQAVARNAAAHCASIDQSLRSINLQLDAVAIRWALRIRDHLIAANSDKLDVRGLRRSLQAAGLIPKSARDAALLVYGTNTSRRRSLTTGATVDAIRWALKVLGIERQWLGCARIAWCGAYPQTRQAAQAAAEACDAIRVDIANLIAAL